jgi:hypothetical protein
MSFASKTVPGLLNMNCSIPFISIPFISIPFMEYLCRKFDGHL